MFINTRISQLLQIKRIPFQDIHMNTFVFSLEFVDILVWSYWLRSHYFFCIVFHTPYIFLDLSRRRRSNCFDSGLILLLLCF